MCYYKFKYFALNCQIKSKLIHINIDEDPELFASFSKALEEILQNFKGNWKKIFEELEKLRSRIKNREMEETYGLDRKKQMPFFRIFKSELYDNRALTEDEIALNVNLTQHIYNMVSNEIKLVGFWDSPAAQNRLKSELQRILLSPEFNGLPNIITKRNELISNILLLAKTNHFKIIKD